MKDHVWIDFEWRGKKYRHTGQWPNEMDPAISDAHMRLAQLGRDFLFVDMIHEAGGTILEIHSIRPDGSIHGEDLPDFKVS